MIMEKINKSFICYFLIALLLFLLLIPCNAFADNFTDDIDEYYRNIYGENYKEVLTQLYGDNYYDVLRVMYGCEDDSSSKKKTTDTPKEYSNWIYCIDNSAFKNFHQDITPSDLAAAYSDYELIELPDGEVYTNGNQGRYYSQYPVSGFYAKDQKGDVLIGEGEGFKIGYGAGERTGVESGKRYFSSKDNKLSIKVHYLAVTDPCDIYLDFSSIHNNILGGNSIKFYFAVLNSNNKTLGKYCLSFKVPLHNVRRWKQYLTFSDINCYDGTFCPGDLLKICEGGGKILLFKITMDDIELS